MREWERCLMCVCACVFHCHLFLTYEQWMAVLLVTCGKITEQMKQENGNGRETDYDRDMAAVSYTFLQCSVIISSWNWCGAFAHHCHKAIGSRELAPRANKWQSAENDGNGFGSGWRRSGGREEVEEKRWGRRGEGFGWVEECIETRFELMIKMPQLANETRITIRQIQT